MRENYIEICQRSHILRIEHRGRYFDLILYGSDLSRENLENIFQPLHNASFV